MIIQSPAIEIEIKSFAEDTDANVRAYLEKYPDIKAVITATHWAKNCSGFTPGATVADLGRTMDLLEVNNPDIETEFTFISKRQLERNVNEDPRFCG